ncbi:MAG TPA: DUF1622 domain-containing protein [Nitrososphaeraceae archaeon]|jgi:uncharacterized membrane protein|nr:DUF1622 domain-containing protein [Nitrososphaeraceae archaeon]
MVSEEGIAQIFLEQLIENTVLALEIIITLILIIIVGITLASLFRLLLPSFRRREEKNNVNEHIGQTVRRMLRGLLISLDFLVAADLLKSILVPTTSELIVLAIIVAIRILLSWSLSKEIESHSQLKRAI